MQRKKKQAKQTAILLKEVNFDICFCSPLKRTKQTLKKILKYHKGLKVIFDDRLKERDYGFFTGVPASYCSFKRWDESAVIPKTIETIEHMYQRLNSFYSFLKNYYAGKNILIVSHSGVGRVSHFYFEGKPKNGDYSKFKLDNAQVLKIDF